MAGRVLELEACVAALRQQVSQLEEIAQLRSQQLADTLHEVRSPLLAVTGYTRMLLKERAGEINPTQREYLMVVRENAGKMTELLKQVTHLASGSDAGPQTLDARELWHEAADLVHARMPRIPLRLDFRLPAEPCMIAGDHDRLALALSRVLLDVVRLSDPGHQVELEMVQQVDHVITRISSGLDGPSGSVGPAEIPPASYAAIRACGGRVLAERAPGKICSVTLTLPRLATSYPSGGLNPR